MRGVKWGYSRSLFIVCLVMVGMMLSASKCEDMEADVDPNTEEPSSTDGNTDDGETIAYDGVDLLVVVDNSGSMADEQEILANSLFELMGNLSSTLPRAAAANVRIGVVSSDLGLQYGEEHAVNESVSGTINTCERPYGDDGALAGANNSPAIRVPSDILSCEDCPDGIITEDNVTTISCKDLEMPETGYAETNADDPTVLFAGQVACMAHLGTEGCGMEQQLGAAVRGLERNPSFLVDTHLLGVLVVSDEEDCSIDSPELFETPEWMSGPAEHLNVACNINDNGQYLTTPEAIKETIIDLKGNENSVVFGAIVGVPDTDECQGSGTEIDGCLDLPEMKIEIATVETAEGYQYFHFRPACTRSVDGVEITSARPGRRYVEVAQQFGEDALVASICSSNFDPMMGKLADRLAAKFN